MVSRGCCDRVDDLGYRDDAIIHVTARFGYMQRTDVPAVLAALPVEALEAPVELAHASYFLSIIELHVGDEPGIVRWRKFVATSHLAADAAHSFDLPRDSTVLVGHRSSSNPDLSPPG